MEKKKNALNETAGNVGKATMGILNKAKNKVVSTIDQNGDGKLNFSDVAVVSDAVKTAVKKSGDKLSEKKAERKQEKNIEKEHTKKPNLNDQLTEAINLYNNEYELMNGEGINLYHQRDKAIDLIEYIEALINSIANHPKSFDTDLKEINEVKKTFTSADQYIKKELETAKKQAFDAGVGVAAGAGVAAVTPTVAIWVATTFGTASTGTAISALSGAAATNAALAWLGGGALASGGLGMAGGQALLALAGPVGWGIAGVSVLTSVVLFARNKMKSNIEKEKEITSVKKNTEILKELTAKIRDLAERTVETKKLLSNAYTKALVYYNCNYSELNNEQKKELGALVNNTRALAALINTAVEYMSEEA